MSMEYVGGICRFAVARGCLNHLLRMTPCLRTDLVGRVLFCGDPYYGVNMELNNKNVTKHNFVDGSAKKKDEKQKRARKGKTQFCPG